VNPIRAEGLAKTFRTGFWMRPVRAVAGVDLDVRAGEIFGFLGPNGAGKTTTIKMLVGLIHPSAGHAWLHGRPASEPASRRRLGFLPEGTFFHEHLTGREFVDLHARLHGVPRAERRSEVHRVLERVGVLYAADQQLRRYSKGMRQRVGLAQALVGSPDVLILDEPMSGLDPVGRKEIRDVILELREEGRTVFFSSHILQDAEMICDRVAIIVGGRVTHQGTLAELVGREILGVELVVEGVDPETHAALAASARRAVGQGAQFLFAFDCEDEAEKALDRVRAGGGRVRSLVSRRRSLEDLVVEESRRGGRR
jgi:ABC-2 type transport system ATP-binding protein